jgi:hypothetical protein
MYRTSLFIFLALTHCVCFAQPPKPARVPQVVDAGDASMVINDRGSRVEVIASKRATAHKAASGKTAHSVFTASESQTISPHQLGVVVNHSMNAQGYITGQIVFQLKNGVQLASDLDAGEYPGLTRLTDPDVYLVAASTPSEFVAVLKRLQARDDLEWVEPMITYGVADAIRAGDR